jgi:Fic family protein
MLLAIQFVRQNPLCNITKIAQIYNVPRTTLRRRIQGILSIRDTINKAQKLTKLEEDTIIRYILDLDSRAFPPRRSAVEDIANRLLAARDSGRVRKN